MGKHQHLTKEERLDALTELLAHGAYRWMLQQRQGRVDTSGTEEGPASSPASAGRS